MPTASPTVGDVLRRFGPALRAQRGADVTPAQAAVLASLERCRTEALGGHVYRCDHCGAERVAYNACRNRHCPSCLGHKSAAWLEARADELLPVPYFHVVFTVPAEIAALALGNKKVVYAILFRAAARTLLQIARDPRHLGAAIGFLGILHTWTQTLLHHPHIHCVVPGGGFSPDGTRWIASRDRFFVSVRVLARLFRGKFLAYLAQAAQRGRLRFAGSTAALADATAFAAFLARMRRMDWVVYAKPPFGSPTRVLKYLARYTHRVAISDRRVVSMTDEHVTFRYRDRKRGDRVRTMTLDGVEFVRRFLLHVLPKGFVRIRHFGFLGNPKRTDALARARALLGAGPPPPPVADSPSAEELPADADPDARCPTCRIGHLRPFATLAPGVAWPPNSAATPPPDTS